MFSNIGGKIKGLAVLLTVIGILASLIGGASVMEYAPSLGLIIIIVGSLVSWISSFVLYGFGEIIAYLKRSNELQYEILNKIGKTSSSAPSHSTTSYTAPTHSAPTYSAPIYTQANATGWKCSCGATNNNNSNFCMHCGNHKNG